MSELSPVSLLSPGAYTEALEQQFALIHDLFSPLGPALFATAPMVRSGEYTAGRYARLVATMVHKAKPFFVTVPITRAIHAASTTLPTYTFTAESFPCPDGYLWLEEPVCLYDSNGVPQLLRAIDWHVANDVEDEPDGIPVLLYGFLVDARRPRGVPAITTWLRLGWTLERVQEEIQRGGAAREGTATAYPPSYVAVSDAFHRFLGSCLSFLEQRITLPVSRPASRVSRRRIERQHDSYRPQQQIQVIELRQRQRDAEQDGESRGSTTDWHCQWIVSGHWRRQYYAASNAHKPRYIAPYVKGPADKPLKAPAGQVFVVKR